MGVTKNSRLEKTSELLIIANQRIMDLEKEVGELKNENKILQNQCVEIKKSVEQDSCEIKGLNRKVTEMSAMFTSKCAEMGEVVNSIKMQYKNLQAISKSRVTIDRIRVLEEEVKTQRLQIISLEEENGNYTGEYNDVSFTLNQYENQMQAFSGKAVFEHDGIARKS